MEFCRLERYVGRSGWAVCGWAIVWSNMVFGFCCIVYSHHDIFSDMTDWRWRNLGGLWSIWSWRMDTSYLSITMFSASSTVYGVNKFRAASRSKCDGSSEGGRLSQELYIKPLTSRLKFIVYWQRCWFFISNGSRNRMSCMKRMLRHLANKEFDWWNRIRFVLKRQALIDVIPLNLWNVPWIGISHKRSLNGIYLAFHAYS